MLPRSFKDRQTPPQRKRSQRDLWDASLNFEASVFLMRKLAPDSSVWHEQFPRVASSDNAGGFCSDEAGKQPPFCNHVGIRIERELPHSSKSACILPSPRWKSLVPVLRSSATASPAPGSSLPTSFPTSTWGANLVTLSAEPRVPLCEFSSVA